PNGPRIVLINGNRQTANPSGEFSLLYFDRYAIDLQTIREFSGDRWREPRERFLGELLAPGSSDNDRYFHSKLIAHGHGRLAGPLLPLTFAIVAAAILLSGEFGRRRRAWRFWVLAAVAIAIEALHLWSVNLAGRLPLFVPLIYASALLPAVAGVAWLALGTRRSRPVVAASHGV
ncbi:MAG: LptF/LptG family permease, partial [Alphaproteobacteria bacterium]